MKMLLVLLIIVVILGCVFCFFYFNGRAKVVSAPSVKQSTISSVCMEGSCFQVELAETEAQRDQGLMNRKELAEDRGMLFIFDNNGLYPFWMKDTLIPLDMIWIDGNNKVVFITQNVQPCKSLICPSVFPTALARYVLEVNAGISKKIGLKIGDEVKISL